MLNLGQVPVITADQSMHALGKQMVISTWIWQYYLDDGGRGGGWGGGEHCILKWCFLISLILGKMEVIGVVDMRSQE